MLRTVVLLHDVRPGQAHLDWLLEPDDSAPLITFRLDVSPHAGPHAAPPGRYRCTRLPDHRRRYLDYEGDIGQGRGVVTRLAAGTLRFETLTHTAMAFACDFGAGQRRWRAHAERDTPDALWLVELANADSIPGS